MTIERKQVGDTERLDYLAQHPHQFMQCGDGRWFDHDTVGVDYSNSLREAIDRAMEVRGLSEWTCQRCRQVNAAWAAHCGRCGDFRALEPLGSGPLEPEQPARTHTPQPRVIQVVVHNAGAISLFAGEHVAQRLSWDEALGEFARMTLGKASMRARYWQHVDDLVDERSRYRTSTDASFFREVNESTLDEPAVKKEVQS